MIRREWELEKLGLWQQGLWRGSFISPWIKRQSKHLALYFITQVPRPPRITASAKHQGDQLQGSRRVSVWWVAKMCFICIFPHPSLQPCYLGIPVHCNHGRCRCLHEDFPEPSMCSRGRSQTHLSFFWPKEQRTEFWLNCLVILSWTALFFSLPCTHYRW